MTQPLHLIHDIAHQTSEGHWQMVVEIPAGTSDKWTTHPETGQIYWEEAEGRPRVIRYLPYPFNYGFIPRTYQPQEMGGDGDPVDVLLLAPATARADVVPVKILGGLRLLDREELDAKLIAVLPRGPFGAFDDLKTLMFGLPGAIEIVRHWFENYKGQQSPQFRGYMDRAESESLIGAAHQAWQQLAR